MKFLDANREEEGGRRNFSCNCWMGIFGIVAIFCMQMLIGIGSWKRSCNSDNNNNVPL